MPRYLIRWLGLTCLVLAFVAAVNGVVDPYGIFRWIDKPGFNAIKPTASTRGNMAKALGVLREHPKALILGNSRAEVGFDPEATAWPEMARPVFNLSIAATGPRTSLNYLTHALAALKPTDPKPSVLVWGIEFTDFLVDAQQRPAPAQRPAEEERLFRQAAEHSPARHAWHHVKDAVESTLTLSAFQDSLQTVSDQHNPYALDLTRRGFNPMQDYLKIASQQGYWTIFNQKNIDYLNSLMGRPKALFDARGDSSPELDAMRAILRLCRENGIALKMVIYPYHAHFQQSFRIAGHGPAFEEWKRLIVRTAAAESRASGQAAFPIWDFSGFNRWTSEPVPRKGDTQSKMQWYWEAGHFKRELGNRVLARIWNAEPQESGFGVLLNEANLEAHIAAVREQERQYRLAQPDAVAYLESMGQRIRSQRAALKN
jgi:hypothetical protein